MPVTATAESPRTVVLDAARRLRGGPQHRQRARDRDEFVVAGLRPHAGHGDVLVHSGMLPCLRCGDSSRFVRSTRRPSTSLIRVSVGSINVSWAIAPEPFLQTKITLLVETSRSLAWSVALGAPFFRIDANSHYGSHSFRIS